MAALKQKHHRWDAKVRIPKPLRDRYEGKEFLYRRLQATDKRTAKVEADAWEAGLRLEWMEMAGTAPEALLRDLYRRVRKDAASGAFTVDIDAHHAEAPALEGINYEIEKIEEAVGDGEEPSPMQQARLFALQDARRDLIGKPKKPRQEMEPPFSEVSDAYMKWWKAQGGLKESNTEQQKRATYRLFAGYWKDRPIRQVTDADAAGFMDALRHTDPCYARSPEARAMTWEQLQKAFGEQPRGLSPATLNRHAAALKALWDWSLRRGHCDGLNPFDGHRTRLRRGVNVRGYEPWSHDELRALLSPPPKRTDLHEVMLVAMVSGMRLNEIAALRWMDVKEQEGIAFFDVVDAKSPAGVRQVPVHPSLDWLLKRTRGAPSARLWPTFNEEGPGKKPGADASREFSYFKQGRGFTSRQKAFHSFRKNVVGQWEAQGVPQSEVAEVVGHEKAGITFSVYGAGISLQRKAEIIRQISYPGLDLGLEARATAEAG